MTFQLSQWLLVVGSSLGLLWLAPLARTASEFFAGTRRERAPGFAMLLSSLVISWLFAKSLTNAANLGRDFGLVGGFAYAGYYVSFAVVGYVIYQLRTEGGYRSIHHFLEHKHGHTAVLLFSLLVCFRLFNEVWSNTMVIGSYFGETGSAPYLAAVLVFTALTLAYSLKGGMSSSLLTDGVQMGLFVLLLVGLLGMIGFRVGDPAALASTTAEGAPVLGDWTFAGGLDFMLLALVQVLSYGFHDPVMTDRGFLGEPKATRRAFYWAVPVGGLCIVLFSLVGVYARAAGLGGEAAVEVARSLGLVALLIVNLIMVTSAASTLDSTFSSWAKLAVVDSRALLGKVGLRQNPPNVLDTRDVSFGRWAMVALVVLGTIPVFFSPEIISATTISGLMVVGLAPVFLFWRKPVPAWAFHAAVGAGLAIGIGTLVWGTPAWMNWGDTTYSATLGASVVGTGLAFILFLGSSLLPTHDRA